MINNNINNEKIIESAPCINNHVVDKQIQNNLHQPENSFNLERSMSDGIEQIPSIIALAISEGILYIILIRF
jgi:hypothetical protein